MWATIVHPFLADIVQLWTGGASDVGITDWFNLLVFTLLVCFWIGWVFEKGVQHELDDVSWLRLHELFDECQGVGGLNIGNDF